MKVMLLKDVYKLGRAGDVKRVADGYGRNYLIPQGLAVLATPEALRMSERIRVSASKQREVLNQELGGVAGQINGMLLTFPARASETGRLYGSVSLAMIADAIQGKTGIEISRRQVDTQPLRELGEYTVPIRLTVDLIPEVTVVVYREGEVAPTAASLAEEAEREEAEQEAEREAEREAELESEQEAELETEEESEAEAEIVAVSISEAEELLEDEAEA